MVYDFQTNKVSSVLTLQAIHTYIWSLSLAQVRYLCWSMFTEAEHEKTLDWTYSLHSDSGSYLDALRICLLIFSVTDGRTVPRPFQLSARLAAYRRTCSIVNAGTGSGKTLSMTIPLLTDPGAVAIVVSPLKRLQITQAEELERFLIKPLVINQDVDLSSLQIKVFHVTFQLNRLPRAHHYPRVWKRRI
jgi:hypothetical protein